VGEGSGQALGQGNGVMPPRPSRRLETFVGLWIPPACREEVLGDLHEKYSGPWQYVSLAMCVVPFVILSRIRRTTDLFVLLTDALLIYGSFLAAVWYTDRTSLAGQWGLLRLTIPTVANLAVLILEHAWDFESRWVSPLISGAVIGIGVYFSLPGELASLLLVGAVELAFHRWANLPQAAAAPALWLKQWAPTPGSFRAKFGFAAAVVFVVGAIIQALTGVRPAIFDAVILAVTVAFAFRLGRSGKE
jgi:hypothetical protein